MTRALGVVPTPPRIGYARGAIAPVSPVKSCVKFYKVRCSTCGAASWWDRRGVWLCPCGAREGQMVNLLGEALGRTV